MSHNQVAFDWLYTFNKLPTDVDFNEFCKDLDAIEHGDLLYVVAQEESAPSTGQRHVHVFTQWGERVKPGHLCSALGVRYRRCKPHYERRRGTPEEADAYHRKDETRVNGPWARGALQPDRQGQGKRTDLAAAADRIINGATLREVALADPVTYVRNYRGLQDLRSRVYQAVDLLEGPEVYILWGATGVGKTHWARTTFGDTLYDLPLPVGSDLLRWPDYDPLHHTAVLLDEFEGQLSTAVCNRICDRYSFPARLYGGSINIRPRTIIFTSNKAIHEWWPSVPGMVEQAFRRRITKEVHCTTRADIETFKNWYIERCANTLTDVLAIDD